MVKLPIDTIPGTSPPRFRWSWTIDSRTVDCEGLLQPSVEAAVAKLIELTRQLEKERDEALAAAGKRR